MVRVYNRSKPHPADAVYIGRGSPWGNPFPISQYQTREQVIERFRLETLPKLDVRPLIGKDLVCFCKPKACHGDLLLAAAKELENE